MTCPFCDAKQRILKENDPTYVLLSNPRRMEGHFLVIPKRHVEVPTDITDEEIVAVFQLVKFVQSKLIGTLGEGTQVRQNYMPYLPDSKYKVAHMHYHVMPRNLDDKMFQIVDVHDRETFEDLTDEEYDRIAKLIA
jgi:diadenosine tetraphosphate (Ap4A) HIT family hydrolase